MLEDILILMLTILLDLGLVYQIYQENKKFFVEPKGKYRGRVSVIIPIRGLDICLEKNVSSILQQKDLKPFEVIYVIDPDDPEKEKILNVLNKFNVKIVYNNFQCSSCSGKIRAQIAGLLESSGDIIVFGDSDTFYPDNWLKELVSPLDKYMATTTFSFALPKRITLKNVLRAGFWTLGFESQAIGGTFLWGGSMAFRRDFFDREVIDELEREWCDDCTLTRIVKRRGGKIGFVGKAIPLNIYDENNLLKWASREVITVKVYSYRGAKVFLFLGALLLIILVSSIILANYVLLTPFILWILKNISRGRYLGKSAILPSLASILGIFFAWIILILNWNTKEIIWRDKKYIIR